MSKIIEYKSNNEMVKLSAEHVRKFLVGGKGNVTDQEITMFMSLCKYQRLNPFLKEAYLLKFGANPAQIIVSKEAFMKRAESNVNFDGFCAGIVVERNSEIVELQGTIKLKDDVLIGGWCRVHRKDRKVPFYVNVDLKEFGKGQSSWLTMPQNMIRKTAIVNALREAFPENLAQMYTEDDVNINEKKEAKEEVQEEIFEMKKESQVIDFEEESEEIEEVDFDEVDEF